MCNRSRDRAIVRAVAFPDVAQTREGTGKLRIVTYFILNSRGRYIESSQDAEFRASAVEVPTIHPTRNEYVDSFLDEETREELELSASTSNSEDDVLRPVMG